MKQANASMRPAAVDKICNTLDRAALTTASVALLGVAVVQIWQVFARYVLNDSPSWTEPFALLLMSTSMMLGAAVGVRASRHFGFFLVLEHGCPLVRRWLLLLTDVIVVAIGLMLAVWGTQMLIEAWDYRMAGAPLPQGITYLPLSLGGALIAVFGIEHARSRFRSVESNRALESDRLVQ